MWLQPKPGCTGSHECVRSSSKKTIARSKTKCWNLALRSHFLQNLNTFMNSAVFTCGRNWRNVNDKYQASHRICCSPSEVQWRSQTKMFDFRLATVFCLGYRLSKHKMTRYFKNLGGMEPWASWLRLWWGSQSIELNIEYINTKVDLRTSIRFNWTH